MPLETGTKLGHYQILARIGAGGMGEVYRAHDPRLGRDVAIKVLPRSFAGDPERQQRFEAEARAAGALNHPNIVTLHDVGSADGAPYLVTEVLEGETLRALFSRGALPPVRAAALLGQAALGLAAAHAKGIVHRDLKPENLFVLPDGRVKVLDFGIAKLVGGEASAAAETTPVFASLTAAGTILGTVSYMAPEQLRDRPVDHRADLFALGAILYEAVAGSLAFPADTAADRVTAILTAEPEPLPASVEAAMPGLSELIRRCLEKRPETRFESARDLAYALEILARSAGSSRAAGPGPSAAPDAAPAPEPQFRRLTFRDGSLSGARFAPDGQTVIYSGRWEGGREEIALTRVDSPESRPNGVTDAVLLAVGPTSELAIGLRPVDAGGFVMLATLARVPLMGGVPRELARGVFLADWAPDGKSLAVSREGPGTMRIEFPVGRVRYESTGWMSAVRVSPDGARLAFLDHPYRGGNYGGVSLIEGDGEPRAVVRDWNMVWGLAWSPDGREAWVSGMPPDRPPGIYAITLDGRARLVHASLGYVLLHDISRSGDVLLERVSPRMRLISGRRGEGASRELSWLDWSLLRGITADGSQVVFDESGRAVDEANISFLRGTDGSPPVRIGEGQAMGFSPDGTHVLIGSEEPTVFMLCPTGLGEVQRFSSGSIVIQSMAWCPDGSSVCISGHEPGHGTRVYRFDLASQEIRAITDEGFGRRLGTVSPDGRWVVADDPAGRFMMCPIEGGDPVSIPGITPSQRPCDWASEPGHIFVYERSVLPGPVDRVDVSTGRRERWLEIMPRDPNGVDGMNAVRLTPDGGAYAASYTQFLSELHVARGLR